MKIHKKLNHHLPGFHYWGERAQVDLRVNFAVFSSKDSFPEDQLHYHKTRTTYFCVLEGELHLEVSGEKIILTQNAMLEVEPMEKYKTLAVGSNGCKFVVIGSHTDEEDKVILN